MAGGAKRTILFLGADAAYLHAFRGPLMRWFQARDYRVVAVAAALDGFDPAVFAASGVTFHAWPLKKASLDPIGDLVPLLTLWRVLRRERPDILFAHTIKPVIYGVILSALAGVERRSVMIPGLGYAFTEGTGLKRRLVGWLARNGYRTALKRAHIAIFQNPDDVEALRQSGALPAVTPTGLVNGSGVDMDHYAPGPWPDGPPRFLMVARLLRDKGVMEFIEAARHVRRSQPDARFVLVGGSDPNPAAIPQAAIDAWVAEGLIEAPGQTGDPRPYYADCHVFVLPSYREGTPRTNLEAMAMARPIVTTDVPGCRQTVIHGENGLMVPARDGRALGEAMLSLAQDLERARLMGLAGRQLCRERFELAAVTGETGALIRGD
jgi:glycosyltransferase involved in cell wall biosynthesis